jgi:anti-sigma regulatory factor (Ser/Thr protein kinase)
MANSGGFKPFDGEYVKAPRLANYRGIRGALEKLEPILRNTGDPQRVVFDMTPIRQCSATGITILVAAMQHLYKTDRLGEGSEIRPPETLWIRRYFEDMEFFRELGVDLEEPPRRGKRRGFWPVTHVSDENSSPVLTRRILDRLGEFQDVHPDARNALASCVNEIVENVFYHADSPIDALVAAQASRKSKKTELVIADTGRGIRPGLAEVEAYRDRTGDDCSAIQLALEQNVSAIQDQGRGIGLWLVAELARLNGGQMLILSNEGGIDIHDGREDRVEKYYWPGTLVAIEFDMDQPIRTSEVYDRGNFPDIDAFDF